MHHGAVVIFSAQNGRFRVEIIWGRQEATGKATRRAVLVVGGGALPTSFWKDPPPPSGSVRPRAPRGGPSPGPAPRPAGPPPPAPEPPWSPGSTRVPHP